MTYYIDPDIKKAHVVIFYRNFTKLGLSHVGLGVNGKHTLTVLRRNHVRTDLFGIRYVADLRDILVRTPSTTHAIIEALWLSTNDVWDLCSEFPNVHFIIRAHSQIGFLQVEAGAVKQLREQLVAQEAIPNLTMSANNIRMSNFLSRAYNVECLFLPNLYDFQRMHPKRDESHKHRALRIGSFGAIRILKNHSTAAAAALLAARELNSDLEFYMSVNREEQGKGVLDAIRNMFSGLKWARLVESQWEPWPDFHRTVAHMDACIQVSMSETFNLVSADATAEGVPSVVSDCIEWAPKSWFADIDDAEDIARKLVYILKSNTAAADGQEALRVFNQNAVTTWLRYLGRNPNLFGTEGIHHHLPR